MAKKKKKGKKQDLNQPLKKEESFLTVSCTYLIWAGLFLSLLVPIMVGLNTFFPFISYRSFWFMGTVQFTFAVWLFLAYHNPDYRPKLNLVSAAMVLFLFSITLSTIFGADPAMSFWSKHERMTGLLMHLHLAAYFLVLMSFLKTEAQWKAMLSGAVAVAVIVSIWGIADNYNLDFVIAFFDSTGIISERLTDLSQSGSTLGNTSFLASYLLINAFFALYLLAKSVGYSRIIYGVTLLIIIAGIYLSPRGRAVQGSFLAGLVILILLYLAFAYRHDLVRWSGRAILALGLLAAPIIGILSFVEDSFVRNYILGMHGMPVRYATWGSALQALKEKPLFGWGLENFEIAFYQHYDPRVMLPRQYGYPAQPWHDRAHNIVIDTLTATGVIGTLIFFALIVIAIVALWYYYFKEEKKDIWVPAIFTALLAAHFIQNLTVFDMLSSYMLIFVVLAFAASRAETISINTEKYNQLKSKLPELKGPALAYSFGLFFLLTLLFYFSFSNFVYKPYQGGHYTNRSLQANYEGSLTEYYPLAIETSPLGCQHIRRHLAETAANRLSGASPEELVQIHFPEVEYMIEEMEKAVTASPENFRFYHSLGQILNAYTAQLLGLSSDPEMLEKAEQTAQRAVAVYREAVELSPTHVNGHMGLAQAIIYEGAIIGETELFKESLDLLIEAKNIEPRLYDPHQMAVHIVSDLLNDQELAKELVEEAVAINSRWESNLKGYLEE